jgi:hypothetical protein
MSEIIEQIGGEHGTTVRYRIHDHHVEFFAAEVLGVADDGPLYWARGASSFPSDNDARTIDDAERYFEGSVKWDGCSHVIFGDEHGYLHLCGTEEINKLANALKTVHARCEELMKSR